MRVLITGVAGFVGPYVARHLLACGDHVSGIYLGEAPALPGVDLYGADLLDRGALVEVFAAVEPDAVVHLAGLSHVGESWNRMGDYFRVNVLGTEILLGLSGRAKVIVVSSAEVYGVVPEDEQPIREDRMVDPRTPYAMTKAAAERLAAARGAVIARSFNLIGAGQAPNFALPTFAAQLAAIQRQEQEPVLRVGNLAARRDFLHVGDGAEAYRVLLEHGEPGEIYNVACGRAWSIREALDRLLAITRLDVQVEPDPARMRPIDLPLLLGDTSRLRELGWTPKRSLDSALGELWAAVRGS
jgi:GDP-4-dehydro-6-deoxy-D-mannose reductase